MNKYGHFDDDAREYIITTPLTPRPWQNRIYNDDLVLEINNHGQGITYLKDHKGRFILYNYSADRYLYIYDVRTKKLWSPSWYPVNEDLDDYLVRHGLNYTVISAVKDGIRVEWTLTVGHKWNAELWQIKVENMTGTKRDLLLVPYYKIDLSFVDPYHGPVNRFNSEVSGDKKLAFVKNYAYLRDAEDYSLAFYSSRRFTGWELSEKAFFKEYSTPARPASVIKDSFKGSSAQSNDPVFSICYRLGLAGGKSTAIDTAIWSCNDIKEAFKTGRSIRKSDLALSSIAAWQKDSSALCAENTITTFHRDYERFVNTWIKKQLHYNSTWTRGWGTGFRDCMQDMDVYRMHDTTYVKKRILQASRHIYKDGHTVRSWAPIDEKKYLDGAVWYVNSIVNYIKESGDRKILSVKTPYIEGGSETVLQHMKRSMDFLYTSRGPDGICRMGYGDWNDALNGIDRQGRGQSVWTTMAYLWGLNRFLELLEELKDKSAGKYKKIYKELKDILNRKFWDGSWYIRAKTDAGRKIGTAKDKEGRIFLNTQSWSILSGVATPERAAKCISAVKKHLYTDYGPVLLSPCFSSFSPDLGRISGDPSGFVENGSNYVHAAMFYAYALVMSGMSDEAWDILNRVTPYNKKNHPGISGLEPYNLTNSYMGPDSSTPGKAMFAWRTGTAGWWLKVLWDGLIGIRPSFRHVEVDARLPKALHKNFSCSRIIRNKNINFSFARTKAYKRGFDLTVDNGQTIAYKALKDGMKVLVRI